MEDSLQNKFEKARWFLEDTYDRIYGINLWRSPNRHRQIILRAFDIYFDLYLDGKLDLRPENPNGTMCYKDLIEEAVKTVRSENEATQKDLIF